jgi:aryl-alcohol dehydrogenase-like predicted oxidoreductase
MKMSEQTARRTLVRPGIDVSAMGLGCWPIGGPFLLDGRQDGYGQADDAESIRALRRALDLGINVFDTSDAYGAGHSERVIGEAFKGVRDQAFIITKFGYVPDEQKREITGTDVSPAYIRKACEASLRRLDTDYIDMYLLHVWQLTQREEAERVADTLEALVKEGKIGSFGWSTDLLECAGWFATRPNCSAIEMNLNVLQDSPELLDFCRKHELVSINRSPLAMGFLSGKFTAESFIGKDDVRGAGHAWVAFFKDGKPRQEFLDALAAIREILSSKGRSLVQGALAWIFARGSHTIPVPGFKSVKQVEDLAGALQHGPLSADQMAEIDRLLGRK